MMKTKMFKGILLMVILFLSFVCINPVAQESVINNNDGNVLSSQDAGKLIIENLLLRNYMLYGRDGLHYAEACAAVGAFRFASLTDDKETLNKLVSRYEILLDDESYLVSRKSHVDQSVIGIIPLQIYMLTQDKRYLTQGLTFADSQWENPTEDGLTSQTRWWIDDMYMVGMLQIQAFRATGEMKYADRAALQIAAYLDKLQEENGLFYHGPDSPFFWGRGNGWVAVAMAEVLDSLPENHKLRPDLMTHYQAMMKSLLGYQADNGMWLQLIDYKDSWAESSCTAMFAYAMAVGMNNGWLDENAYEPAVNKALNALIAHIDPKGNLREICVGTGKGDNLEYYLARPRQTGDFHGQAPVLWLITELLGRWK